MSTVPLNLIRSLLLTHIQVVKDPTNLGSQFIAYKAASNVFDDYAAELMKFGRDPKLNDRPHDVQFYCMLVMTATKLNTSRKNMLALGMRFVEEIYRDSGLSIDAFLDLICETEAMRETLGTFLHTTLSEERSAKS